MADADSHIGAIIAQLASADAVKREQAARTLFRLGCAKAEPVLRNWFADSEFRALARSGSSLLTVGVAAHPTLFEKIRGAFGSVRLADAPADQDVIEFELEFANSVRLDILTTRDPDGNGAISTFLKRFGEGIQQIECDVRDVVRATELLKMRFGLQPVYSETHAGANNTRVNFFLAPASENQKVLIELVEVPQKQKRR